MAYRLSDMQKEFIASDNRFYKFIYIFHIYDIFHHVCVIPAPSKYSPEDITLSIGEKKVEHNEVLFCLFIAG